jgi:hypothetical protein
MERIFHEFGYVSNDEIKKTYKDAEIIDGHLFLKFKDDSEFKPHLTIRKFVFVEICSQSQRMHSSTTQLKLNYF